MWVTLESLLIPCFHFQPLLHAMAALTHNKRLATLSLAVEHTLDTTLFHVNRPWTSSINGLLVHSSFWFKPCPSAHNYPHDAKVIFLKQMFTLTEGKHFNTLCVNSIFFLDDPIKSVLSPKEEPWLKLLIWLRNIPPLRATSIWLSIRVVETQGGIVLMGEGLCHFIQVSTQLLDFYSCQLPNVRIHDYVEPSFQTQVFC